MKNIHTFTVSAIVRRTKANKKGEVPVYIRIVIDGKRTEIATKHFISPSIWESNTGRAKGKTPIAVVVNETIDLLKLKAKQQYNKLLEAGQDIDLISIKNGVLGIEEALPTLLDVFDKMVADIKSLIGIEYTESTYKNYLASQRHLHKFIQTTYNTKEIGLKNLDYKFISEYELYLKTKGGCTQNGCIKHMQKLRKAITIALQHDYILKDPFSRYSIKKKKVFVEPLTKHELAAIENRNFSTERLNIIRDLFIFSCYTGLAFSDASSLRKDNIRLGIDGEEWIFISRQKTGSLCKVPLLSPAKAILQKYAEHPKVIRTGCLLPTPSNQKFNAYLKEIADIAGIHKTLTTHLGRHTFATTVALQNGVPIEIVKEMLGHADIHTTQMYAKVKDELISSALKPIMRMYEE